jgi:Tol biopolymer transport system component
VYCKFGNAELWLANLETGKTQKIVNGAWKPAWSKDGEHLLYVMDDVIYVVDTNQLPAL